MTRTARIGGPIALAVIGAILYFAVSDMIEAVDLTMIGLILMIAGAVWLVIELIVNRRRSAVTSERTSVRDPRAPGGVTQSEREVRRDEI
ncbi:DUF6458 family protein [Litorihabitans aurantiacus]|uniref:DUF6458 domain-containing protein n=1 Tax=Litorihabitans aurantiacus TaxID=1930061 RepID=A0AA37UWP4_9MICO|nr:DUF6458 family protein [Litorihabitans aurantiacus]GMA30577.1 hypothetical protein GCM10025875_05690 [Litorihabitans aurantiacus]